MRGITWVLAAAVTGSLLGAPFAHAQQRARPLAASCAAQPSSDTAVYSLEAVDSLPRIRKTTAPNFSVVPAMGTQLSVRVAFVVNQDGTVDRSSVRLVGDSTGTAFDQDAKHWIASLVFWPACRDGKAVRAQVVQPVNYNQMPARPSALH